MLTLVAALGGLLLGGGLSVWIEALLRRRPPTVSGDAGDDPGKRRRIAFRPLVQHTVLAVICGGAAVGIGQQMGPDIRVAWHILLAVLGVGLAVTDMRRRLLPNEMVGALAALALAGSLLGWSAVPLAEAFLGGAVGFVLMAVPSLIGPRLFGAGDAKLAAALGFLVGYPWVLMALYCAVVIGGVLAAALLATRQIRRRDPFPFGPCLLAGTFTAALWGPEIFGWYQQAFPFLG